MPWAAVVGAAALGALGGAQKDKADQEATAGVNLNDPTALENQGRDVTADSLTKLTNYTNQGPGDYDIQRSLSTSRSLGDLLAEYSKSGGLPSQADITASNDISSKLFGARKTALDQSFVDQNIQAQRLSAQMGRPVNDPVLQAKLRTSMMRQSDMLQAEQQGTAQQIALQLPGQRVGYLGQSANVLGGLATQAFQNRAALLQYGSSVMTNERNFRYQASQKYQTGHEESGGGLKGAIAGGFGGAAAGMKLMNLGGSGGGGGGGGGSDSGGSIYGPSSGAFDKYSLMSGGGNMFSGIGQFGGAGGGGGAFALGGEGAGAAGAAEGAGGMGALAALSDVSTKKNIKDGTKELRRLLDSIGTDRYEYKDSQFGKGFYISPMAQELEKTPLGKNLVIETKYGKAIDYGKGYGLIMSALGDMHKRLKALEKTYA